MENNKINVGESFFYEKKEIDNLFSKYQKNYSAELRKLKELITKLAKAIKQLPICETDYDLINKYIDQKIEISINQKLNAATTIIDERISAINNETKAIKSDVITIKNELDIQNNTIDKRLRIIEPKPEKEPKQEIPKKFPPFIIDDYGKKLKFLKINRTTKKPMYQLSNGD